jgi:hypothetical protein
MALNFGSVLHKVINGVHHLFSTGAHAVEQVKVFIDARPGLKDDLDKLLGPIKDAVESAVKAKLAEVQGASPADALSLVKKDIPDILGVVKSSFADQAHHAGNLDLILSLATNAVLAVLEPPQAS